MEVVVSAKQKIVPIEVIEGGNRPQTVREFSAMFESIFGAHNREVGYTPHELVARTTEEVLDCLNYFAKDDWQGLDRQTVKMFGWLNSAANSLGIDLQAAAWHKYPGVCNRCFASENCGCVVQKTKYDPKHPMLPKYRRDTRNMPELLDDWQGFHRRVYGRINALVGPFKVFCHLADEMRELSVDFRRGHLEDLQGEFADVFFWLIAFANSRGIVLSDAVWEVYPYQCDVCHVQKCECEKL